MPSRRERLAQFAATATPAKAIRRASLSLARALVALSEAGLIHVSTPGLLSIQLRSSVRLHL